MNNASQQTNFLFTTIMSEINANSIRVKTGLDIGFANAGISQVFRLAKRGAWITVEQSQNTADIIGSALGSNTVLVCGENFEMPFEDRQFDIAITAPGLFNNKSQDFLVREMHRVLKGGGCWFLPAKMHRGDEENYSEKKIYQLLRDGFDVLSIRNPPWWKFGRAGHYSVVVARRKTWRNASVQIVSHKTPVSDSVLRVRD